ncbi:beta-N-acetylhexosaminidase [Colwellia asteriadis]|uniref:beta-N-acetylhexosaminidase n=1 Tax=Colwellia asteriadis TaxID=517723 RepID=A0ABN1L3H5_9GAMM
MLFFRKKPTLPLPVIKKSRFKQLLVITLLLPMSAYQINATDNRNHLMTTKVSENANAESSTNPIVFSVLEQKIAQKMSLDIRYFCADIDGKPSVKTSLHCRQALTELPVELSQLISDTNIGGIVLFAENVVETAQIVTLTDAIQKAALKSSLAQPLIISVDQEGGRVARFAKMTGFSGNMAIGASYPKHGSHFAEQVNSTIAKELKALGINNNYAPVVDVNTNADNPVINTRSFGEDPQKVSELGLVALNAIQQQGIMGTLKHFPGHGDTHVDSHLGLPRVDHNLATIEQVDLAPFSWAIKHAKPAMIMTAHIQYPALDSSTFTSQSGEQLIRPATMSKKILSGLLRNKMGFDGIIATDALDMAGVTHFFTPVEAVVETFIAGADLAVMPFKVRTPDDIYQFKLFIKKVASEVTQRIAQGDLSLADIEQSLARLNHYKAQYIQLSPLSLADKIAQAQKIIATDAHLAIEQSLANAAVTLFKNNKLLPLSSTLLANNTINTVHLIAANAQELAALQQGLAQISQQDNIIIEHISHFIADTDTSNEQHNNKLLAQADVVIATLDVKMASLVDLGGMDDAIASYGTKQANQQKRTYEKLLKQQLKYTQAQKVPSILIAKGSPFLLASYSKLVDAVLLNFDDRIYAQGTGFISPGINASMQVIFTEQQAQGVLPVSL